MYYKIFCFNNFLLRKVIADLFRAKSLLMSLSTLISNFNSDLRITLNLKLRTFNSYSGSLSDRLTKIIKLLEENWETDSTYEFYDDDQFLSRYWFSKETVLELSRRIGPTVNWLTASCCQAASVFFSLLFSVYSLWFYSEPSQVPLH